MSVKDLGLIGGQIYSVIDFSSDAMNVDIMKRVRNFGDPGGSPYEYAEASYPIYVVSLTRVGGVTTVVLDRLLADDKQLKAGFRLVLTCPRKSSFDVEYAEIKSVTSGSTTTTFTYDNPGPNETYNRISDRDIIAAGIHSIKVDSTSQQPVADFHAHLAAAPLDSGVTISDLNGTYDIHFGGTPPTSLTAEGGATLSGSGSSYTLVVDSNDTLGLALNFAGVPSNGSFTLPTIIRNDHSAADYVRLDFKQFLSRYKTIRMMDLGRTNNNSYIKSWSKRPKIFSGLGMPLEDMIAMCNQLGCDMWYCIPQLASDDYITNAATLIKNTLNSSLNCYFERSNEHWNSGTFDHIWWDLSLLRVELNAYFHGVDNEVTVLSVSRSGSTVTVNLNKAPPFANGATGIFKILVGNYKGYQTPDAGATMTVSGNSFSFSSSEMALGAPSVTVATVIGNVTHPLLQKNGVPAVFNWVDLTWRWHGKRTYDISQLVKSVFGSLNGRARILLMGLMTNFVEYGNQEEMVYPWLESQYELMKNFIWGIGGALYPAVHNRVDNTVEQLANDVNASLGDYQPYLHRLTWLSRKYGVKHVEYESNIELSEIPSDPDNLALMNSLFTSPYGRTAQKNIMLRALGFGADLHMLFTSSMQFPNTRGSDAWGVARTLAADGGAIGSATSERQKGIDDVLLLSARPGNLDQNDLPGILSFVSNANNYIDMNRNTFFGDGTGGAPNTNGMRAYSNNTSSLEIGFYTSSSTTLNVTVFGGYAGDPTGKDFRVRFKLNGVVQSGGLWLARSSNTDLTGLTYGGTASPTTYPLVITAPGYYSLEILPPATDFPNALGIGSISV